MKKVIIPKNIEQCLAHGTSSIMPSVFPVQLHFPDIAQLVYFLFDHYNCFLIRSP